MATGGVFLTEDDLSCEICFDLYTDPMALKCLHTFCGGCISQLADNRRTIECPSCREKTNMADVRKDFRIQKLLDQHLGQVTSTSAPAGNACEMCKKKGQSIQMYCADCDKLLCIMCCRIHADIKDIANHTTIPKRELIQNYRSELQTKLDLLKKTEIKISINAYNIGSDISRIEQEQGNLMKKVDEEIDKAMHQLNKTRLELHKKIKNLDKNIFESLTIRKGEILKEKGYICTSITQIQEVMDKNDIFMLKNVNSLVTVPQTMLTVPISMNHSKFPSVKVVTGSWSSDEVVKVVPVEDKETAGCSLVRNKVPVDDHELPDFSVVRNNVYVQCKTVNSHIISIQIIVDKLYCACGNLGIKVYDKNCDFIRSITSNQFGVVTGVAKGGTGDIIVLVRKSYDGFDRGGLHQVTLQGRYVTELTDGDFNDVCSYDGIVYGLKQGEIQLFKVENNEYVMVGNIGISAKHEGYTCYSMCINKEHIYVSTLPWNFLRMKPTTIFVYNHQAKNIQQLADRPHLIWLPKVFSVDSHSNLLVVDQESNTVYVYIKDESIWHKVMLEGLNESINDAVADERGDNIWIVTSHKLIKYTRKLH